MLQAISLIAQCLPTESGSLPYIAKRIFEIGEAVNTTTCYKFGYLTQNSDFFLLRLDLLVVDAMCVIEPDNLASTVADG